MNAWMLAAAGMLPPLAACLLAAASGPPGARLVAYQLACAFTCLLLVLLTYAFDQPALIDLALCLSLLGLPGALLFATFLERWL